MKLNVNQLMTQIDEYITSNSTCNSNTYDDNNISDDTNIKAKALGTIVNIWSSRRDGTVLHIVIKDGSVEVGDVFVSGGTTSTLTTTTALNTNGYIDNTD